MIVKTLELRDRATFIPVIAIGIAPLEPDEADRYLLGRAGYAGMRYVLLARLEGGPMHYSPHAWGHNRTMTIAHGWLCSHFDELESGAVVDVEYLLREREAPRRSEREEHA